MGTDVIIEIIIDFIKQLEKKKIPYSEAINQLEKTKELIKSDTNQKILKEETKQNVVEDRKDDK